MAAFNYRELIRQAPPGAWQLYFQARQIDLPQGVAWTQSAAELVAPLQAAIEALPAGKRVTIYSELRRVQAMANRRGMHALRNSVPLGAPLLEALQQHTSDAERALWAMTHWPAQFAVAEALVGADVQVGKRHWKRLQLPPEQVLHIAPEDIAALQVALAQAFTPRRGKPRACEVDVLTRHLDGGVQLDMRIEDDQQRRLEFGPDDKTVWREVRPPLHMAVVIYPGSGVLDLLLTGGDRARKQLLGALGRHVFRQALVPLPVPRPLFLLNRLRDGLVLDPGSGLDLSDHGVEAMRLSACKVCANVPPQCDYLIKPAAGRGAPDALACLKAQQVDVLLNHGFTIVEAVVSLYFFASPGAATGRVLHLELKPAGIGNLRDLDDGDALLAEALMRALGVQQGPAAPELAVR